MGREEQSLALADRGFWIFPVIPNGKRPLIPGWQEAATTDPETIGKWFRGSDANIGISTGPSRLVVIDLDMPKDGGPTGAAAFAELAKSHGATFGYMSTFTVRTASGGLHLYFRVPDGVDLRNSVRKLGPSIDVRAEGGLVVAPGSEVDGSAYLVIRDCEPAPLPSWLTETLTQPVRPEVPIDGPDGPTSPYAEKALQGECGKVRGALEGTRNDTLVRAAFALGQLVAEGQITGARAARELLDAADYAGLEPAEAAATVASGLKGGMANPRRKEIEVVESRPAQWLSVNQLDSMPEPEPLIADTIDKRTVAELVGQWGTCKSFIALDWALSVATGKAWHGRKVEQGRVLYIVAEGAYGLSKRVAAWRNTYGQKITNDALIVQPTPINLMNTAEIDRLCERLGGFGLIIIDTLSKCMVGADENSAQAMSVAVDSMYRMRDATGAGTVLVVHHTGKDGMTSRGSGALDAGVDTVYITDKDVNGTRLRRIKRKEGKQPDTVSLRLVDAYGSAVLTSNQGMELR